MPPRRSTSKPDFWSPQRAEIRIVTGEALEAGLLVASPDVLAEAIAARQRRAINVQQLTAAGLTRAAIRNRSARGRLHRMHRAVYLAGHADPLPLARETAALLACGPGTGLRGHSAAAVWGFRDTTRSVIDVVVVDRDGVHRPGIRVHSAQTAAAADLRVFDGLLLTSPARTLIDLAATLGERDLRWALEEAQVRRLVTLSDITRSLESLPRLRGVAALRRAVQCSDPGPAMTRSEAERRLLDLIRAARLPAPSVNVRVAGFEVDAYWHDEQLVVEVDGFAFHRSHTAFERDRRRDAALQLRGIRVVRLTWRRLNDEPESVIALIAGLLARGQAGRDLAPVPLGD